MAAPAWWGVVHSLALAPGPLVRWALAAWACCAVVLGSCQGLIGPDAALLLHAALVPIAFFVATLLAWNHDRHLGPVATCLLCPFVIAAGVVGLDLLVLRQVDGLRPAILDRALGSWVPVLLVLLSTLAATAFLATSGRRRRFLAWTASQREQRAPLPGDTLLDDAEVTTHAITIRASPAAVWAVVAALGTGTEGFRTYDAEAALPAVPALRTPPAPGDRLPFAGHGAVWFEVLEALPGRHLVLGAHLAAHPVHGLAWAVRSPRVYQRATWTFALRPVGEGTRLLARVRVQAEPPGRWVGWGALFPLGHLLVERLQLLEIRRCAEQMRPAPA